ncbi:MAG: phospho-N-acetylmuramoyl-pentapeptide-transferase [Patescibacteria group bacterium]|nr:phospho-N-acetylmuramoyl-pentapeptide-transferase [Patescibacteria group bacterium]MDE2144852.1 phospho-N-acetylmuramoyl-pentapeptide-transferase [Patescibacteria group bacterium]
MMLESVKILLTTIAAFLVAMGISSPVLRLIKKLNARKQIRTSESAPIFSKLHKNKEGTPTMGGIIIWGTVLIMAIAFLLLHLFFDGFWKYLSFVNRSETYLPLAALIIAAAIGLVDDILGVMRIGPHGGGLAVRHKILIYLLLSIIGAWWFAVKLQWNTLYIPFLGYYHIGWWYIPIFIFVVFASAFSANETDGLDGLLGGVSLFAFGALSVIAFSRGMYDLSAMTGAISGALLAFLWNNIYPAKFFMGDTGSMALGITLGVVTMLTNSVFFLPFFGVILVIESLSVLIQVFSKKVFKRKVFLSAPIHHHFEALGWPESQVTMRFWIISLVCTGLGLVLYFLSTIYLR